MTGAVEKRLAKLAANLEGDQIPICCEDESEVPPTLDRMIAAGELTEADRALCVYRLDCRGPDAVTHVRSRSWLEQCEAEAQQLNANAALAPEPGTAD
jgi:hypothetical protein